MMYKPVQPMSPSLTCMIFGDPHLRTFDSRYQTCNLLGARSLIEHPLFDVQITNTRLQNQFNATGVTKVVVQVRRFKACSIGTDLVYETDSLTQDLPSSTFTDGSTNPHSMISIHTSSMDLGLVVSMHLDHIGVRIYISQFTHTKFINVVVRFRTATSATVKHKLVLDAISPISLCKTGCARSEVVDLVKVLNAAGIDIAQPSPGVIQEVDISKDTDGNDDDDEEGVTTDDDDNASESNFGDDDSFDEDEEEEFDDDEEDDDGGNDEFVNTDALMQPQKDPRSKRVKKEADNATTAPRKNRKNNKERNKNKNRNRKNKDQQSGSKRDLSGAQQKHDTTAPVHQPVLGLKASQMVAPSKSVMAPPVPLGTISSFLSDQQQRRGHAISSSTTAMPELPPLKDQLFQNDNISLHELTLTDKCNQFKRFHRLSCLYDVVLKGIPSVYPHTFAVSFDEPRLPDWMMASRSDTESNDGVSDSGSPSLASSSPINHVLLLIVTLVTIRFRL